MLVNKDELITELMNLEKAKKLIISEMELWNKCHLLAEMENAQAKEIFIRMLDSKIEKWRNVSLKMLGFHYRLDNEIIAKVQKMLINDISAQIRSTCVYVIASQSKNLDNILFTVLRTDKSRFVRESAFYMILDKFGVSYIDQKRVKERIKRQKLRITERLLRKVLFEFNITNN